MTLYGLVVSSKIDEEISEHAMDGPVTALDLLRTPEHRLRLIVELLRLIGLRQRKVGARRVRLLSNGGLELEDRCIVLAAGPVEIAQRDPNFPKAVVQRQRSMTGTLGALERFRLSRQRVAVDLRFTQAGVRRGKSRIEVDGAIEESNSAC